MTWMQIQPPIPATGWTADMEDHNGLALLTRGGYLLHRDMPDPRRIDKSFRVQAPMAVHRVFPVR